MNKINLFEAFSGIGSQHRALENIGFQVNSVGISDWYIDAIIAYGVEYLNIQPILPEFKNKNQEKKYKDDFKTFFSNYSLSNDSKKPAKSINCSLEKMSILKQVIDKFGKLDIRDINLEDLIDKDIDLFTYSFPCQDISQQGNRAGFTKGEEKTRSGLLWEIERILKEIKSIDKNKLPKVLMMENVKAILNEQFKPDLDGWIKELENLGYKSTIPFCVNSSDVGSPQNRTRVFMISKLEGNIEKFPEQKMIKKAVISDILQKDDNREKLDKSKYSGLKEIISKRETTVKKSILEGYTTFRSENYVYYKNHLAPTITASGAQSRVKFIGDDQEIYFLNSLEHLLLQGFSKDFYSKLKLLDYSETKIKFLAGNSINVVVLEKIFGFYLR